MTTLYVDQRGSELSHDLGSIRVRCADGRLKRLPLVQTQRVVVACEASLSVGLLRQLAAARIPLFVTAGRSRSDAALLWPQGGDARRRLAQYALASRPTDALALARTCVRLRVGGQLRLLRRARTRRPDLRYPLLRALRLLAAIPQRLRTVTDLPALRGLEGVAARIYFGAYARLLPAALGFAGRRRRPPPDPVNATLSLGYSLLLGRALECVHAAGLDAALGVLHEPSHNRPSAACDLMECERHAVEWCVHRLFAEAQLREHHFGRTAGVCLLGKEGREPFFGAIEPVLKEAQSRMRTRLHRLLRVLPASAE